MPLTVRKASPNDAPALLSIYAPYVKHTAITFEYDVPSVEEFTARIRNTLKRYPYLVAQQGDRIIGYAYASSFHTRKAYEHCAEVSIYVDREQKGKGIGKLLYTALEEQLLRQNVCNLYACIACPKQEDEYLTFDSVRFHEHLGYSLCGSFHDCGYKFGRWYGMVWMEKMIGAHRQNQPEFLPYGKIE